jgi:MSHA biogenesis protein MshM
MYLNHFGLNEAPFRITPHTDFFFDGANRGATLEALLYAITHDEGIVKVSGEVGSGKTMLCRVLIERLPKTVEIIYLSNPSLARDEILRAIAEELRVEVDPARTTVVLRALQEHLIKVYATGHQVVVLIDEAHAMPLETLEEIRLLSNLETSRHKLLQIVLFGQPELDVNLNLPQMRQLKERITHNFRLEPLIRDDIAQYLMFRMRAAGYRGPDIFTKRAIRDLTRASQGLTRRINILADKALLAAYTQNTHQVGARQVKAAVRDSEFHVAPRPLHRGWVITLAAAAGIVLGVFGLRFLEPVAAPAAPVPVPHDTAPAAAPAATSGASPAVTTAAATTVAAPASAAPATAAPVAPTPSIRVADAPAVAPATTTAATDVAPAKSPSPPSSRPVPAAAVLAAQAASSHAVSAEAPPAAAVEAPPADAFGPLTRSRMAATEPWLKETPGRAFAIQVMAVVPGNARELEAFLTRASKLTGLDNIYVYETRIKGQPKNGFAVVYGSYPSRDKVRDAIDHFPPEIRTYLPYLRTVDGIRRELASRETGDDAHGAPKSTPAASSN